MVCPVKGEAGFVEDVQIVIPLKVESSFAWVTAFDAILPVVIALESIFAVVTALEASWVEPIEAFGIVGTTP